MKTSSNPSELSMNLYCCMYSDCGSEYSTKFNLKRHVESVHMHLKKFQCSRCQSLFSSKQSLKEHLHIHSGAMPFKCSICEKNFRQASQLSLHKRVHMLEGVISTYKKIKVEDLSEEIKPMEISYEVNLGALRLPDIDPQRAFMGLLPFPQIDEIKSQ